MNNNKSVIIQSNVVDDEMNSSSFYYNSNRLNVDSEIIGRLELLSSIDCNVVDKSYEVRLGKNYIGRDPSCCNIVIPSSIVAINEVHALIHIPQLPSAINISQLTTPYITTDNNTINLDDIIIEDLRSLNKTHLSKKPM
jgi:hypothetical protein